MSAGEPWRDDTATTICPLCQRRFVASGRSRYCSDTCRKTAWRRRHQPVLAAIVVPAGRPRRTITVYECATCGTRMLGQQRCEACGAFAGRVGIGGLCPHCDEPVAVTDLVDETLLGGPGAQPAATKASRR